METRMLTCAEAAHEMRVTRKTMYRWIKDGLVPTKRIGRKILIPASTVEVVK